MKIIRHQPADGKPPRITCTGCGKRTPEAGIAVKEEAVEKGWGPDGPVTVIDMEDALSLCEDCVTALQRSEAVAS